MSRQKSVTRHKGTHTCVPPTPRKSGTTRDEVTHFSSLSKARRPSCGSGRPSPLCAQEVTGHSHNFYEGPPGVRLIYPPPRRVGEWDVVTSRRGDVVRPEVLHGRPVSVQKGFFYNKTTQNKGEVELRAWVDFFFFISFLHDARLFIEESNQTNKSLEFYI